MCPRLSDRLPRPLEPPRPSFASPDVADIAVEPLINPLPTARGSGDAVGRAVDISMYLTRSGSSEGLAESMSATSPDTAAVAIEVPEPRRYGAVIDVGNVVVMVAPGAARLTRCAPGATTSGLFSPSAAVGP